MPYLIFMVAKISHSYGMAKYSKMLSKESDDNAGRKDRKNGGGEAGELSLFCDKMTQKRDGMQTESACSEKR